MSNTHGQPDVMREIMAREGELLAAVIVSTTWPSVPAPPSLTLSAFATRGYVRDGAHLVYVDQPAHSVTLSGGDGSYWLALHRDTASAVAGWAREAGTHYLWIASGTPPGQPPGGLVLAFLTVSGGVITAVDATLAAPRHRVAFSGDTGAVVYDPAFTYDPTTDRLTVDHATLDSVTVDTTTLVVNATTHRVGMFAANPTYDVDISATAAGMRVLGPVGLGTAPDPLRSLKTEQTCWMRNKLMIGQIWRDDATKLNIRWVRNQDTGITLIPDSNTGAFYPVAFLNSGGTQIGSITQTTTDVAYNTTSDARLKTDIAPLTGALAIIQALNPIRHRWKVDGSPGVGFAADELQQVVNGVVSGEAGAVDDQGDIIPQMIDYSKLVPWLTAALKETLAQVETLTARVQALEAR